MGYKREFKMRTIELWLATNFLTFLSPEAGDNQQTNLSRIFGKVKQIVNGISDIENLSSP